MPKSANLEGYVQNFDCPKRPILENPKFQKDKTSSHPPTIQALMDTYADIYMITYIRYSLWYKIS